MEAEGRLSIGGSTANGKKRYFIVFCCCYIISVVLFCYYLFCAANITTGKSKFLIQLKPDLTQKFFFAKSAVYLF